MHQLMMDATLTAATAMPAATALLATPTVVMMDAILTAATPTAVMMDATLTAAPAMLTTPTEVMMDAILTAATPPAVMMDATLTAATAMLATPTQAVHLLFQHALAMRTHGMPGMDLAHRTQPPQIITIIFALMIIACQELPAKCCMLMTYALSAGNAPAQCLLQLQLQCSCAATR